MSEPIDWRKFRIKDPFSGISHAVGAVLAIAGLVTLIILAQGRPWHVTSFAIYGATLILLFLASSLYHSLRVGPKASTALYAFDRAAIYALIAGTYTPLCWLALPSGWGWSLFGVVWGLAIAGIVADLLSKRRAPHWLQMVLYFAVGWVALIAIVPLVKSLSMVALFWLAAGSVLYTIGAFICVTERPRLRPGVFDAHDLWHVFVLAASACHFIVMLLIVSGGHVFPIK